MNTGPLVPAATVRAPRGLVCTVDHLASGAGVAMLRAGGNAADAAVAASAVLAVTNQHLCGMGGDLFAIVHHDDGAPPAVLNASGRAGSGADAGRLRDEGRHAMPFSDDLRSAPVPGCVDGWVTLHDRFGALALADVLAPAIDLAAEGFPAVPTLVASWQRVAHLPDAADYLVDGQAPHVGAVIRRPGVARTLGAVVADGRAGFYQGEFGDGLVALGGGEYTAADLARSQADWVDPIAVDAWGHRVWGVPPNSQAYLALAGAWVADGLALPTDADDPQWAHLLVEAAKQVGHDRTSALHERADGAALVHPERLAARRAAVDPLRATGVGGPVGDGDTMYMCAAGGGLGVSLIQSNASGWGCHVIEPTTRIFLHNRGIGFSLVPGHPAEYGPGRRPPHTLAPTLVTRPDGTLRALVGTMGGDAQPQVVLQLLARLLHGGESPGRALAAGRWRLGHDRPSGFDTWADPSTLRVDTEGHAPLGWDDGLVQRGHRVKRLAAHDSGFGHAHVIEATADGWAGAADHRALAGAAQGW